MSRSTKLPIVKDKPRNRKRSSEYWRRVRRVLNQTVSSFSVIEDEDDFNDLPNPKAIVDDYDYCDYVHDMRYETTTYFNSHSESHQARLISYRSKYSRK